jgi:hypothetical protein
VRGTTKCMERSTTNQNHESKPATTMNMNTTRRLTNENYGSKDYRTAESVYFYFLAFLVELGTKTKTNYKAHENTSRATSNLIPLVAKLIPDLPRGRGRSIGGDLNVGEEGFEQTIVTLQSLHHGFVGYQYVCT